MGVRVSPPTPSSDQTTWLSGDLWVWVGWCAYRCTYRSFQLHLQARTLTDVPRHSSRLVNCLCGRTVMLSLGCAFPIECVCGLDYDPRTGEPLPVCERFEIPGLLKRTAPLASGEAKADDHRAGSRASVSLSELRIPVKPTPLAAPELTAVRVGDERTVAPRTLPGRVGEVPAILR